MLLGERAHSGLGVCPNPKPLTFLGQFEKLHREIQIAVLWVDTQLKVSN